MNVNPRTQKELINLALEASLEKLLRGEDILVFFYTARIGPNDVDLVDYGIGAKTQRFYVLPPDTPYTFSEEHDWWIVA